MPGPLDSDIYFSFLVLVLFSIVFHYDYVFPAWYRMAEPCSCGCSFLALPVNEYLDAVIIIQLSIKLVLLAAWRFFCLSKRSIKTPDDAGPAGSLVLLASGGTPKTR